MRRLLFIVCCCGLSLAAPAGADGAGGPVPPQQGGAGVSAPGSDLGFVATVVGRSTLVQRVRHGTGTVERFRLIDGSFGVPGVAYDGSATGLSADGGTLVLADAGRQMRTRTRLVVLDARTLRPRARIVLPGFFTVDAISPDGRWMYVVHYTSATDLNRYEVRAYDLRTRRLLAKPVIDPREPDEKMQGLPVTRVMSADGRWAYTLYQSLDGAPFVHALDTAGRTAACIDLDDLTNDDLSEARLVLAGGTLRVDGPGGPLALVDTRTFKVRGPAAAAAPRPPAPAPAAARDDTGGGDVPWELTLLALVPLVGLAVVSRRRRRRVVTRH
jgi:hypothetical protein